MDLELRPQIRLSDTPPDLDTLIDDWIARFSSRSGHVFVKSITRYDKPPTNGEWSQDVEGGVQQCISIFTDNREYAITARYDCRQTYLGCIAKTRKPRAGETHARGSDLHDGLFTYETWFGILGDIVSYEMVQIAKSKRPVADGHPFPSNGPVVLTETGSRNHDAPTETAGQSIVR